MFRLERWERSSFTARTSCTATGGCPRSPAEVENAILAVPGVADCAVIGVPDDTWGEVGRAIVAPRPGARLAEADMIAALAGRLAKYKIPKSVVFADGIPRNTTGKILKDRLRDTYGTGHGSP